MRPIPVLVLVLVLVGCARGPATGTVKGTITVDGQPVDGGLIKFVPADGNSQPGDCIVHGGAYSVTMPIGEKKVEIYWTKGGAGKVDTATQGTKQIIQMVPAKYNTETTLKYTLEKGTATKDFALTSR